MNSHKQPENAYLNMDLLRLTTAGSVDDGKSTLIGRLLYDSKSIFEDQMEAIENTSRNSGETEVNLALLTDGLRAEREQKITIDVAYRYFATPKRKFIIADTPGHIQYTRNMVTGASTADLAIILVDAKKGVLTQSKRHSFISSLLQIPHVVVAINKMDLVDYSEEVYQNIVDDFKNFAKKLEIDDINFIPMSALKGDNIVNKSENMSWYNGATLLHYLENVNVGSRKNMIDFRFPVQYVIRPNQNFRGFAGTIASGTVRVGDEVITLPSRIKSTIKAIHKYEGQLTEATAGDTVTLTIEDDVDISRGDMIVRVKNLPRIENEMEAFVCWMNESPMQTDKTYLLTHTTNTVQAIPIKLRYKMDIDTLHRKEADVLELNEIGRVKIKTAQPLFFDPYKTNNATGSFILIDSATNVTVGAGMIRGIQTENGNPKNSHKSKGKGLTSDSTTFDLQISSNVIWEPWNIPREEREIRNGHKAMVLWFTGISGSGKSTIAKALEKKLWEAGKQTVLLDGDQVRHGLNGDLGFSDEDRSENIRRVANLARLFYEHGNIVLCTFISPFKAERDYARSLIKEDGRFMEIFVDCSIEEAKKRDPKGLYKKAMKGEIKNFTGIDSSYEISVNPELRIDTENVSEIEVIEKMLRYF
jgi:bifunctional enzyme CysN/CysC